MKLETIKKDKKKNIIIGSMIVLSVVGCLTLTTTRAKYKSVQSVKLANGTVKLNSYDFKVMAMYQSEDGENYTDVDTMPTSGYIINEEKSYCTTDNKDQVKGKLKTIDGNHVMVGLTKNDKCYIWFDKYVPTAYETLIASFEMYDGYKGTVLPDFTQVATGAEAEENNGIYKVADGMYGGESYYWRGAASTNHVILDSKCWRIVRINGDGTIRLIYNGTVQSGNTCKGNGSWDENVVLKNAEYNGTYNNSSYVGWSYNIGTQRTLSGTRSPLRIQLEDEWYTNNISESAKLKIATGKFCNDRNTQNNEAWRSAGKAQNYAAYSRLMDNKSPTLSCPSGDVYELKIGMITADEVTFAGASGTTNNISYYLYNGQFYWTMTPFYWNSSGYAGMFIVSINNSLSSNNVNGSNILGRPLGVRPVINLRSDVTFNTGSDGTQSNPYIVQ